ncbi:MAG: hypothetical protein H0X02_11225, partial [Nitrosomonas sp.]|nr:hypothetical protein [Nitrosomonas sp.]
MKRLRDDELQELVEAVEVRSRSGSTFENFAELFRIVAKNKLPKPIINLVEWHRQYPEEIYVVRTADQHLELAFDRSALLTNHRIRLKVVQNFERCLMSVKPK